MTDTTTEIHIRKEGRAGRITLDRPKALNALTYAQIMAIAEAIEHWRDDDEVHLLVLDSVGDRAFCAGGDIVGIYESRTDGPDYADQFWRDEYKLNADIASYPKPFVALMDGIVMGGGVGISAHASHRIVTERSEIAMPETSVGLVPDVGGMWLLANAPGRLGEYYGIFGERMNAGDAIYAGFADTCVPSSKLDELVSRLIAPQGDTASVIIADLATPPAPPKSASKWHRIDEVFDASTIEDILSELSGDVEWEDRLISGAKQRSPLSMKLTLAAIHEARHATSLEEVLNLEYRLTTRLFRHGEFLEGIRALLIDKDRKPKWNPPELSKVSSEMVTEFLSPLSQIEELGLQART